MRTLADLRAHLEILGVDLSIGSAEGGRPGLVVEAPAGALTAAIVAELSRHREALLATLAGPAPPAGDGGAVSAHRRIVALWPEEWRGLWGRRANEREGRGEPWDVAERRAFVETSRELATAEDRGEVPEWSYPDPSAVAAIVGVRSSPVGAGSARRSSASGRPL